MMTMSRAALICLVVPLLGFVPPRHKPRVRAVAVRVVDAGQTYSSINTIECLGWPSEEIKKAAGYLAWGGWSPKNGDRGIAFGRSRHCFQDETVVLVRIGEKIAPLGQKGLELEDGSFDELPMFAK